MAKISSQSQSTGEYGKHEGFKWGSVTVSASESKISERAMNEQSVASDCDLER